MHLCIALTQSPVKSMVLACGAAMGCVGRRRHTLSPGLLLPGGSPREGVPGRAHVLHS